MDPLPIAPPDLIAQLRAVRLSHGLTQTQMAAALGMPLRTLQKWEGGETRPPTYAARLLAFWLRSNAICIFMLAWFC